MNNQFVIIESHYRSVILYVSQIIGSQIQNYLISSSHIPNELCNIFATIFVLFYTFIQITLFIGFASQCERPTKMSIVEQAAAAAAIHTDCLTI